MSLAQSTNKGHILYVPSTAKGLIWDLYTNKDIDKLESIQKRVARFIKHDLIISPGKWLRYQHAERSRT